MFEKYLQLNLRPMKCLILAENLEVNRTSSGLRSHKQILLYRDIFSSVNVITSTEKKQLHTISEVNYHFLKSENTTRLGVINKIPKSVAVQNYLFGLDLHQKISIENWKREIRLILTRESFDYVISLGSGASFLPAYAVYKLKGEFNFKHLMFIHDPYPLNQYPPPYQKKNSLPYKSVAKLFGKVLKNADILSFPSLRLKEWMADFYPHLKQKSIIQPHIGLTPAELKPYLQNSIKNNLPDFPKGINIVHTGSLLGPRNPNFLIEALQQLFCNMPETQDIFYLHIIGKINKTWHADMIVSNNVFVHSNRVSYLTSLEIQQKADILLIIEAAAEVSPFMPGKLADYLIAKKPILALTPKTSETARILGKDYALITNNGDTDEIYNTLYIIYRSYLNQSLDKLVPEQEAFNYVRPENWVKQLEKTYNIK